MLKNKFGITEGIFIAAVPAIGYWLAFLYQLGYCTYFNIPAEFIEINLQNVMVAVVAFVSILGFINLYGNPIYLFIKIFPHPLNHKFAKIFLILLLIAGYSVVYKLSWDQIYLILAILALPITLVELLLPVLSHRDTKGYINKLKAQDKIDKNSEDHLMDLAAKGLGKEKFLYVVILLVASFIIYFAGAFEAKTKRNFIIHNNSVVLKKHQGSFVMAKFDSSNKKVYPNFSILDVQSDIKNFKMKKIGPLIPVKL